jgi:O-antigen ligase
MRRSILPYAIALDLVVIATGAALLFGGGAGTTLAIFLAAVLAAAWLGGQRSGATATAVSLVAFGFLFEATVAPEHYVIFAAAGSVLSLALPPLRNRVAKFLRVPFAAATPAEAVPRPARPLPQWLPFAMPLVVILIFSDVSDVLMRTFGSPSLLQPSLIVLGVVIWYYRDTLQPHRLLLHPIALTLYVYSAMLFVSSSWAADAALADVRVVRSMKNLSMYAVVSVLAASWPALRRGAATLAVFLTASAAMAIFQITTGFSNDFGGLATLAHGHIYEKQASVRAAGPVGDPNYYGQMLLMILPLALYLGYTASKRLSGALWVLGGAVIVGGVLVTYSRGAMVALAVMTAIVLAALRVPIARIAIGTAIAVLLLVMVPSDIGRRFTTMLSLLPQETYYVTPDASFERRKLIASTAARMFSDHTALGVGAGNYRANFPQYSREAGSPAQLFYKHGEVDHAHSLYLEIASENGALGLLVFAAIVAASYASILRSRRALEARGNDHGALFALAFGVALTGYLLTSIFLHGGSIRYLYVLLAFVAALSCLAAEEEHQPAAAGDRA